MNDNLPEPSHLLDRWKQIGGRLLTHLERQRCNLQFDALTQHGQLFDYDSDLAAVEADISELKLLLGGNPS